MKIISLPTHTSYDVLSDLRKIMKDTWKLREVCMDYNTKILPDYQNINSYPVTLIFDEFNENIAVKIFPFSVGYGGSGPTDFSRLLEYFEIPYDEDEIFTKKSMGSDNHIRLNYLK